MADAEERLRRLLDRLAGAEGGCCTLAEPLGAGLRAELLAVGAGWPATGEEPAGAPRRELLRRLGRHLAALPASQQDELIAAFAPLREDLRRSMLETTVDLRGCLSAMPPRGEGAAGGPPASRERLVASLRAFDEMPHLRCYRQCGDAETRVEFLLLLASAIRAAGELLPDAEAEHPGFRDVLRRLTAGYFKLPKHGDVMDAWLDARLEGYNLIWQRAVDHAVDCDKGTLQTCLTAALQSTSCSAAIDDHGWYKLPRWPMVRCPLAQAFLEYASGQAPGIAGPGGLGPANCPTHALRPATLLRLLRRLPDAFQVSDRPVPSGSVRLRSEHEPRQVAAGATRSQEAAKTPPEQLVHDTRDSREAPAPGKRETDAPAPKTREDAPAPPHALAKAEVPPPAVPVDGRLGAPPTAGSGGAAAALPLFTLRAAPASAPGPGHAPAAGTTAPAPAATPSPADLGFEAPAPRERPPRSAAAAGPRAISELGGERAAPQDGPLARAGDPRPERRAIDWQDTQQLERMVRTGLSVDEDWRVAWMQHCDQRRVPYDFAVPLGKDVIAEFVERNLYQLLNKAWAKDLMYKSEVPSAGVSAGAGGPTGPAAPNEAGGPPPPPAASASCTSSEVPAAAAVGGAATVPTTGAASMAPGAQTGAAPEARGQGSGSGSSQSRSASSSVSRRKKKKAKSHKDAKVRLSMIGFSNEEGSSDTSRKDSATLPSVYHKTRLCFSFLEGKCTRGKDCSFAHSQGELRQPGGARQEAQERLERRLRRGEKKKRKAEADGAGGGSGVGGVVRDPYFKTQLCPYWMQGGHCAHGKLCYFAHSQDELRTTPEATLMMNQMLGMPMMMGGGPPGPKALVMSPMAMMGPPMLQRQAPALGPGAAAAGPSKKQRKDRDRAGTGDAGEGEDRGKSSKGKEKEGKEKKKGKESAEKKEKKDRAKEDRKSDDEPQRNAEKEGKKDKDREKAKTKKEKKQGKSSRDSVSR
eukprot:CAMPEP_0175623580 /NCGR_PEP_ID=MMETSP0096-20121207/69503_1 /TAXON_ID=311494 /ORGANISM="Alexandrium monilatum, Strain CCMP3105" /LENGTH=977 /DNA_ID=CAMNT_0016928843 /DNA_START=24 /DNA_END=2953 /DNA_ORIENTATION=+